MNTPRITDTVILDDIIRQLGPGEDDLNGRTYANYDDGNIYIDASVRWHYSHYDNYIDGYLEGVYDEVTGWDGLEVDAYIGEEKAEIDEEYIYDNLKA